MPRISYEDQTKQNINMLLQYAKDNLSLLSEDVIYIKNILLDLFKLTEPCEEKECKNFDLYETLSSLSAFAVRQKLIDENERSLFESKIMGILTPLPSRVIEEFDDVARYSGVDEALNYLYKLSEANTYLRRPDLDKNIVWKHENEKGDIVVTINLAKPEKTPEQVRLAKLAKGGYPKCMLCKENVGFAGNLAKPARQTLRTIPFELDGEEWFMQFSPYQYFEQHVIAISAEHRPMGVSKRSFKRMLDFVDLFPNYFIGSNAALPIVGGSILAHDHYQGGKKVLLPVFSRSARKNYLMTSFADVNVSIVDWYNSVVRITSKNRAQLIEAAEKFRAAWENYSDENVNIISSTLQNGEKIQHNAVTPICDLNRNGEYEINLILRNNRTDEEHPFGIFHPAKNLHNIKQESIGIIEVMGLFILPGRLQSEMTAIKDILTGKTPLSSLQEVTTNENHPLHKHLDMIAQLVATHNVNCSEKDAEKILKDYIDNACERILDTTAVFKNDENGQVAFDKFIQTVIN